MAKYRITFRDEKEDKGYYVDVISQGTLTVKDIGIVSGQGLCVEGPISDIEVKVLGRKSKK